MYPPGCVVYRVVYPDGRVKIRGTMILEEINEIFSEKR
jgi:hypothetical protein